jgi:O-acetyl-ADP-ribose deacetylase (regulator of RNase III)
MNIQVVVANLINQPDAQAVINSANANLRLGSGVAGAIHTAAGDELENYCEQFAPLALGMSVITPGFKLPNQYVIHSRAGHYFFEDNAEAYLESAYRSALNIATSNRIESIAMPAMGIGVFKFPVEIAAQITAKVLNSSDWNDSSLKWVRLCVSSENIKATYLSALSNTSV